MAQLIPGTTIGGFTALHSGLANASLNGTLTVTGKVTANGGISVPLGQTIDMDTGGLKKGRLVTISGQDGWMGWTVNAGWNGSGWTLDDTSTIGWVYKLDTRPAQQEFAIYMVPAGGGNAQSIFNILSSGTAGLTADFTVTGSIKTTKYVDIAAAGAPAHAAGRIYFTGTKLQVSDGTKWNDLGGADPTQALTWTGIQTYNTKVLFNQASSRLVIPVGIDQYAT